MIVGTSESELGSEAYRWTPATGMVGLGDLPGGYFKSIAEDVSSDGSTIVGYSYSSLSDVAWEAFRWTEQLGMQPLGDLSGGDFASFASTVSSDGKIVFGSSMDNRGYKPFVWDESHGMRNFQQVLVDVFGLGTALTDWHLFSATDISDDGLSIVGAGYSPDGNVEAWLARLDHPLNIPEPSALALAILSTGLLVSTYRRPLFHV